VLHPHPRFLFAVLALTCLQLLLPTHAFLHAPLATAGKGRKVHACSLAGEAFACAKLGQAT
jgi:hypothetical protein